MNQSRITAPILFFVFILVVLLGSVWGTYRFSEKAVSGNGFIVQWVSIHSLVKYGNSPYGEAVTAQIQDNAKGETSFAPGNLPRYTSPLFSGLVVFPFALIGDKTLAHALWLTTQLFALLGMLLLGLKLTNWKPRWYIFLLLSIFTIFSYHVMIPWLDGGLSIWAALILILALLAIQQKRNEIAGVLLAFSAIQPQMVVLTVLFCLIWAVAQKRKTLIIWFFITIGFISIMGLFLVPDWLLQYLRILIKFQQNFPPGSPEILFKNSWPGLGKQLGWLVSVISILILIFEWWMALKKEYRWFLWTVCLTLVISQWVGIQTIPGNFTGLILPFILIAAMLTERWPKGGDWAAVLTSFILFVWEWAIFWLDIKSPTPGIQLNLIIPLPLVLLIGLYWVRWWAVKPRRLMAEELKLGESY